MTCNKQSPHHPSSHTRDTPSSHQQTNTHTHTHIHTHTHTHTPTLAPSAMTMMLKTRPCFLRLWIFFTMHSSSNSISGMRTTCAPAAIPDCSASHPASLPITSTIITRSWLRAVSRILSSASVIVCEAVSKLFVWVWVWV
jgi:hypothetical protein